MMHSLAAVVTLNEGFGERALVVHSWSSLVVLPNGNPRSLVVCSAVRPRFTETGPLIIKEGRHPVMEHTVHGQFVATDCIMSELSNLHIITGPNSVSPITAISSDFHVQDECFLVHLPLCSRGNRRI